MPQGTLFHLTHFSIIDASELGEKWFVMPFKIQITQKWLSNARHSRAFQVEQTKETRMTIPLPNDFRSMAFLSSPNARIFIGECVWKSIDRRLGDAENRANLLSHRIYQWKFFTEDMPPYAVFSPSFSRAGHCSLFQRFVRLVCALCKR